MKELENARRIKYIFVAVWLKKTQTSSCKSNLKSEIYFRWPTLLTASCSPAEPSSSSGSNVEISKIILLKIRHLNTLI